MAVNYSDRKDHEYNPVYGGGPSYTRPGYPFAHDKSPGDGRWSPQVGRYKGTKRTLPPGKCDYCEADHYHQDCPRLNKILRDARVTPATVVADRKDRKVRRENYIKSVGFTVQEDEVEVSDHSDQNDQEPPDQSDF
jgi:hypothetical protein